MKRFSEESVNKFEMVGIRILASMSAYVLIYIP